MPKISPFLWFNGQAEEATQFYVSLFKNSKVLSINRYGEGSVMSTSFELDGQHIMALNGGPDVHIHGGRLLLRELRDTGRGR